MSFSASKEKESELFDFAAALALTFTEEPDHKRLIHRAKTHTQVEGMALEKDMKSSSPLLTLLEPVPDGFNTF